MNIAVPVNPLSDWLVKTEGMFIPNQNHPYWVWTTFIFPLEKHARQLHLFLSLSLKHTQVGSVTISYV